MSSRFLLAALLVSSISFLQANQLCDIWIRNDSGQTLFIDDHVCLAGSLIKITSHTQKQLVIKNDPQAMTTSDRIYVADLQIRCDAARREYDDAVSKESTAFRKIGMSGGGDAWNKAQEKYKKAQRAKEKAYAAYNDLKKVVENFKK